MKNKIRFDDPYGETIHGEKLKLILHPDGYHFTLPAHYSDERVASFIELTRKQKQRRA